MTKKGPLLGCHHAPLLDLSKPRPHHICTCADNNFLRMATLVFLLVGLLAVKAWCWWPFSSAGTDAESETLPSSNHEETPVEVKVQKNSAKFEISNAEQKFLAEAHNYLNLSPLEQCQHSVSLRTWKLLFTILKLSQVISKLQRSCGEMTDEELGKFSVHLLNCQSQAEGRTYYTCSDSMVRP